MREEILREIRRLAKATGGKPPGFRLFEQQTGIRQGAWRGVYWARWRDAVTEAGFQPNASPAKHEDEHLLSKFADVCRSFGRIPTAMEYRIHGRTHPDVPNHKAIYRNFHSTANMLRRLAEWAAADESRADVAAMLAGRVAESRSEQKRPTEGFVYLIRWGAN